MYLYWLAAHSLAPLSLYLLDTTILSLCVAALVSGLQLGLHVESVDALLQ